MNLLELDISIMSNMCNGQYSAPKWEDLVPAFDHLEIFLTFSVPSNDDMVCYYLLTMYPRTESVFPVPNPEKQQKKETNHSKSKRKWRKQTNR